MSAQHARMPIRIAAAAALALALPAAALAMDFDLKGSLGEAGFTHYVAPVSGPIFNETPYITTEARPMWMHQAIPNAWASDGGDIDVIAVQLRAAITDRIGFIATKDGWADIDFNHNVPDTNGAADLAFGFKYAAYADPETNTLATLGVKYEAPSGGIKTAGIKLEGSGDGLFDLFVSGARTIGNVGLEANLGTQLAVDMGDNMSFLHYSLHADYNVVDRVFPLVEFNGYTPINNGNRTSFGANGMDLVNMGATNADTVITMAPGFRIRLMEYVDYGIAFEFPLTNNKDLMDWRMTTDFVIHM